MHNEELHNLYSSPNIITRRMKWTGYAARMGVMRRVYSFGQKIGREEIARKI
jgi:hypothetical protein